MNPFMRKAAQAAAPSPIPSPRIVESNPVDDKLVETAVRIESGRMEADADTLNRPMPETMESFNDVAHDERIKLERLIDDDFPFDESQLAFIDGMVHHLIQNDGQLVCGTGAAGTGKTTCTKAVVDRIANSTSLSAVDMDTYWKRGADMDDPDDDDYEKVERFIPSIAMCAYTGRATQMIRKNFPRSWHGNIMTIHRMLAFMPVFEEFFDEEQGQLRNRMHFEPTYTADNKMPWDYILIDETGMLDTRLWEQVRVAMKDTCKVIMIGDINQLPPVHGRSVFGFAMSMAPSWELTHIHRQAGKDNPIVDNAWRVLQGQLPVSGGAFQMTKIDGLAGKASQQIRKFLPMLAEKGVYDPIRDTTITGTNGHDGSRGYALGQLPLNREFAMIFNREGERYIIDAGREKQKFAVGDKVMATRNDYNAGITNGMTGLIVSITENGAYAGDRRRFGTVAAVNDYMREVNEELEDVDMSVEDMLESYGAQEKGKADAKESRDRGPASHIVTVRFGDVETGIEIPFATLAEVASLMTAYVVTCHKMQGGESPVVVIILHDSQKMMYYREWLYTAITRASGKCILLYTDLALRIALQKQKISGKTLAEKVEVFKALTVEGVLGPAVRVALTWGTGNRQLVTQNRELSTQSPRDVATIEESSEAQPMAPVQPERNSNQHRPSNDSPSGCSICSWRC